MENRITNWIKRASFTGATIWRQDVFDFIERTWPRLSATRRNTIATAAIGTAPASLRWALT